MGNWLYNKDLLDEISSISAHPHFATSFFFFLDGVFFIRMSGSKSDRQKLSFFSLLSIFLFFFYCEIAVFLFG